MDAALSLGSVLSVAVIDFARKNWVIWLKSGTDSDKAKSGSSERNLSISSRESWKLNLNVLTEIYTYHK